LPYSVSYTQSGILRYRGGIGTVWGRYGNGVGTVRERYGERLELQYGSGMGWLGLVYGSGMGAVLERRYEIGMGMIGFGIRERDGKSIGAAVSDLV